MQAKRDRGQDPGDEAATKRPRIEEPVQEQAARYKAPQQASVQEPLQQPIQVPTVQHVTPEVRVIHPLLTLKLTHVNPKHLSGEATPLSSRDMALATCGL